MKRIGFIGGWLALGLAVATAAINPDVIRQAAPEILKLEVEEVRTTKDESRDDGPGKITITAYVMVVTKSPTKLQPGDKITISYERYVKAEARAYEAHEKKMKGMAGAQFFHQPDIPGKGDLLMAYLKPDEVEEKRQAKIYHPGADQYSFEILEAKAKAKP